MSERVKSHNFRYTPEMLKEFSLASLRNADALIQEAIILSKYKHLPRAYFLAISSVEESGKAFLAYNGLGRNLQDSAVTAALRRSFENHEKKINAGFHAWILKSSDVRNTIMPAVDLIIALKNGREPSMYTDFDYEARKLKLPWELVSKTNAFDCIRVAFNCLVHTSEHINTNAPISRSRTEDELFSIKDKKLKTLLNREDFWWYYIDRLENGDSNWTDAISEYKNKYECKGRVFRPDP